MLGQNWAESRTPVRRTPTEEEPVKRTRALLALMPVALVATLLTACTSDGGSDFECAPEGAVSNTLAFDGDFASSELTLTNDLPVEAEKLERTVLIEGDGEALKQGDIAQTQFTIFKGSDGTVLSSEAAELTLDEGELLPWALQVIGCSKVGERVAAAAPVSEILGEGAASGFGLEETDNLVLVFDVTGIGAAEAAAAVEECETLAPREAQYPEVELGDGATEPQITIPACMEPPTELEIEVLVEGDGAVVEENQQIMTNYVGVDWNGAVRFDGNWSETGIEFSTAPGALIEGFTQAMVGQKIGSTVLVTMPSELGYNDGMTRTFVLQLVSEVSAG